MASIDRWRWPRGQNLCSGRGFFNIPVLDGRLTCLEPLAPEHTEELAEAVTEDDLYRVWFTRLPSLNKMGTGINTEIKLLQPGCTFKTRNCIAVGFLTQWHNRRSRAAIEALGAKQDGVLCNRDLWRDGTMREVVVFSIIAGEWPTVRLSFTEKLARRNPSAVSWAQKPVFWSSTLRTLH